MKRLFILLAAALMLLALAGCGGAEPETDVPQMPLSSVVPDPYPPVPGAVAAAVPEPSEEAGAGQSEEQAAPSPTPVPTPTPTPTPVPTPVPLVPGTYKGSDGSVLKVKADGSCTFETEVSGTVNGKAMTGRLTFHGTVEEGTFSFTKVTYLGLDLTEIARASGFTSAAVWEQQAAALYAVSIG